MNPRVTDVVANEDFTITVTFTNGEVGTFDVRPYLEMGIFRELKDWRLFRTARPFMGTVQWVNEQDLCPDTIYLDSKILSTSE